MKNVVITKELIGCTAGLKKGEFHRCDPNPLKFTVWRHPDGRVKAQNKLLKRQRS